MTTIVGIDPGLRGGLTFLRDERVIAIEDMPVRMLPAGSYISARIDGAKVYDLLVRYVGEDDVEVYLEHVAVLPTTNERSNSAQSQGSLVRSLGIIEGACDVFNAPPRLVDPKTWQRVFGLVSKSKELRARGAIPAAHQAAMRLYPAAAPFLQRVKDDGRADSLLIAHWGSRYGSTSF